METNGTITSPATGIKRRQMENTTSSIESLFERLKSYIETRIEIIKLKAIDKSSSLISGVITYIAVFLIFGCFFCLFNIGLALLIGSWLGHAYYGFFILAAFYAVAGLVIIKFKNKWIKNPLINTMVQSLHE